MKLKDKMAEVIPQLRTETKNFVKTFGDKPVSQVTLEQVYGGMRGIKSLVCDTSSVEPDTGLIIRGKTLPELADRTPEEMLWLLLTGELPDAESKKELTDDLAMRREVPEHVWDVMRALPDDMHPMTMFSIGIAAMQGDSKFYAAYNAGAPKEDYWISTLDDCMDLVARVPVLAAGIYRLRMRRLELLPTDARLPLSLNFARLLGVGDPTGEFADLMRLYLVLHCDHESGNVSALTTATVSSALSDLYYSVSAGMNGLAGPLHGLANQECVKWILMVRDKFAGVPTDEQIEKFAWDTLNGGHVIPGYGHAVLRVTDPRFTCFYSFGERYCRDEVLFQIVKKVYDIVPKVLQQVKKIKDPWPNVDAISGALLYHYGVTEFPFYTVLFGVSRTIGVSAQAVLARGLGLPIIRPKSVTSAQLRKLVSV